MFLIVATLAGRLGALLFSGDRCSASVGFDVHLVDGGVVYKPIYGGQRHCRIREHAVPFSQRLIGRDHGGCQDFRV